MAEELDFHLLELARAEGEVSGRDLVAKTLADLGDAEGNPHPRAVADVLEVDEDALGRLGAEEDLAALVTDCAGVRLEHQIEFPRLGQVAATLGTWRLQTSLLGILCRYSFDMVQVRAQLRHLRTRNGSFS